VLSTTGRIVSRSVDKRTAEWQMVAGLMQAQEVTEPPVEYRIDSRCLVCSAPDRGLPNGWAVRNLVDEMLVVPKTYAAIMRLIEPLTEAWPEEVRISRHSLRRHSQNHLRWEQAAARQIAERNAQKAGKRDEASERMLVSQAVLEAVQQRGYEALVSGEITPSVRDTLSASATLREIEREAEGQFSVAEAFSQLDTIIQTIREVVPTEYHEAIVARLEAGGRSSSAPPVSDPAWDDIVSEMGEDAFR
jgi:hypothetical protein